MDDGLLSEKQIAVLKNAFSPDEYSILENICRYYGLNDDNIAEVEGWINHGTEAKPLFLTLIYEYVEHNDKARFDKSLYYYNKYRF